MALAYYAHLAICTAIWNKAFIIVISTLAYCAHFTAADVVPHGGRKSISVHHYTADFIFWSFVIFGFILKIEYCLGRC